MSIYFRFFKVGNYFQLKCSTPTELSLNVVYKFSCPCDTALSYIGYTTRHLITRAHEHLNLNSIAKSAVKDHMYSCSHCSKTGLSVSNFEVIKKCNTGFEAKIQEALLIKKFNSTLNRQLYSSGSSYLLNIYCQFIVFLWCLFVHSLLFLQYFWFNSQIKILYNY